MAGTKGKSGRRAESKVAHFQDLIDKMWTQERRERVMTRLLDDCESENFQERNESRKLLLAYRFGKPAEQMKHTGEDGGAIVVKVVYDKP